MLKDKNLDNWESSDLKTPQEPLSRMLIPSFLKVYKPEKRNKSADENMENAENGDFQDLEQQDNLPETRSFEKLRNQYVNQTLFAKDRIGEKYIKDYSKKYVL